ncbi:MAG: DUF1772 domain-containing protein [Actinomycetota bacterium]
MLSIVLLALATIAAGLTAGAFFLYANAIMPGLRRVDDRAFVAAFQAVDRAIVNPVFLGGCFVGTLVLAIASALANLSADARTTLGWIVAAGVLHLGVMAITVGVHVPRNDALKAAGEPGAIDVAAVRAAFDERRWVAWNHVRVVLSIGALACFALAGAA